LQQKQLEEQRQEERQKKQQDHNQWEQWEERLRKDALQNYVPWAYPYGRAQAAAPEETQIIYEERYEDSLPVYRKLN
jgi:hypothetical protein